MLAVRVNDIDRHIKAIRIHSLKQKSSRGSNDPIRVVPLQSDFLDELLTYISDNRIKSSDRLFQIGRAMVHRIVKDTCKKAGYADSRAHPHTFRHSFAIHCLLNSTPIEVVQKVLGHRLLSTTMIYAQIIGADARPFLEGIQW
jgi:integrase